ncbi:ABC transporter permease [Occallatibacter savannae]|uniref:ABC transporter permease n=1 Tax=Occallatibacter savannae TaxID=1002691 RepID=UPI000D692105|nr:ABC transporter permease [Occallatibacter savannae]
MGELWRRISYLFNRRRLDSELESDMEFHREMATRAGRNNFGNTLRMREQAREAWGWTWLDRLLQDIHYGARILARSPGFTVLAVLVLGIGIGVNVAAFSFFNMVALKPLPVRDPASLVRLERRSSDSYTSEMAYPSFAFYRDHARTLSAAMAILGVPPMQIDDDLQPTSASFVTPNYFTELGTPAAFGRLFTPALDDSPASQPSVVLSYELWQHRFSADPAIIGRTIRISKRPATVIGILPYDFASLGGQHPALWMPIAQQPYFIQGSKVLTDWNDSTLHMWGRLAPGISSKVAEQDLRALTDEIRKQHPNAVWDNEFIQSSPGGHLQIMQPRMYEAAVIVGVLTLLILAVSCANLGGLMLARAVAREREIGIRIAIGAGRSRILRQLFTESLMLASLGSAAGLALGCVTMRVLLSLPDTPQWVSAVPDWRILLFTAVLTFLAATFFGLAPALQIARQRQQKTIVRQILVAAQVAASCVLLIVAALLVRATQHLIYTDPGFGYEQLISIDSQLGRHGYSPEAARAYLQQMQTRLSSVPGITSVALVRLPPLGHTISNSTTQINGRTVTIYQNWVEPGFFTTMRIPLITGRDFMRGEKRAVIVSESFARQQWLGQNPLGKEIGEGAAKDTVVGVAGDAHINALNDDDAAEQYWSAQPDDMPGMVVIARASGEPGSFTPAIKSISQSLDPKTLPEIRQIKLLYRESVSHLELIATAVSAVGIVAVAMAGIGLIGLVAFTVSQRTKEIAIRIALGARPAAVLAAVLRQFSWPVLLGLIAGTVAAGFGSRLLRIVLYGVSNLDPIGYAAALIVLAAIVAIAALLPARRALRLDIARTLHYD